MRVRLRDQRGTYLRQNVFELLFAVLSIIAGVAFFAAPDALERSAIGRAVHPFDYGWNALYVAGGILVALGLFRMERRLELAGLSFLTAAVAIAGLAVIVVRGTGGAHTVAIYTAAIGAFLIRASVIRSVDLAVEETDRELERRIGVERRTR